MSKAILGLLVLAACGDKGGDTDTDTTGSTTATTTGTTTTPTGTTGSCTALQSGQWTANGAAFGMEMTTTLTMDVSGCSFTLGDWTMPMGDLPTGGTVAGDQVTLEGTGFTSCTGTAASPTSISGICSDDGSDFTLDAQ